MALRYISDPTNNNQLEKEACSHGTHWEDWESLKMTQIIQKGRAAGTNSVRIRIYIYN